METLWYRLIQVHLEKWLLKRREKNRKKVRCGQLIPFRHNEPTTVRLSHKASIMTQTGLMDGSI